MTIEELMKSMTIEELMKLMEDDGTEENCWDLVTDVLPKIFLKASTYFGSYNMVCEYALGLAAHVVAENNDEHHTRVALKYLARIAYHLLDDSEELSAEAIEKLETIEFTYPELEDDDKAEFEARSKRVDHEFLRVCPCGSGKKFKHCHGRNV